MAYPWCGILDIPEGKAGSYEVKHIKKPAGTTLSTANIRTAFIGGDKLQDIKFKSETRWHELSYDEGVWMTDLPIEQAQHDKLLQNFKGRVLVGGLGLGYAVTILAQKPLVKEIVVVEKAREVIDLVWPHLKKEVFEVTELVNADLFEYLEENREARFDFGFYDIWQSDGETTFFEVVLPLRKLSADVVGEVVCWNENVMRGQLVLDLRSQIVSLEMPLPPNSGELTLDTLSTPTGDNWHDWSVPFFKTVKERRLTARDQEFMRLAHLYAATYGLADWETFLEE